MSILLNMKNRVTHLNQLVTRIHSAEREGFEPPVPLSTVVFKTTVIDHSTISPVLRFS